MDEVQYQDLIRKSAGVQNRILEIVQSIGERPRDNPIEMAFWAGVAWQESKELFNLIGEIKP